jgi:hypothetical protein
MIRAARASFSARRRSRTFSEAFTLRLDELKFMNLDSAYTTGPLDCQRSPARGLSPLKLFFTSVHGPSFPNHLFTLAAQSAEAINNPNSGGSWGCDSGILSTTIQAESAFLKLHALTSRPCRIR